MTEPFIGQIMTTAFQFAPKGWALANGQLLAINQNTALFALLGTQFGGNGSTTFALPNLQGRVPVHADAQYRQGAAAGESSHTLIPSELPQHTHALVADTAVGAAAPTPTSRLAASSGGNFYAGPSNLQPMSPSAVSATGGFPHENMAPSLVVNYCIALQGIFPSRN
ncbi:MAG TPA: tail fiber protein [Acidimicrobiales bacterium]|nr:tail fiber protein [Acidimicrobiales bacterium]